VQPPPAVSHRDETCGHGNRPRPRHGIWIRRQRQDHRTDRRKRHDPDQQDGEQEQVGTDELEEFPHRASIGENVRPQQITRLNELEEQLTDLFSEECRPAEWRKAVKEPERKEAWTQKKVALSTVQLIGRIQNVLRDVRRTDSGTGDTQTGETGRTETRNTTADLKRVSPKLRKEAEELLRKHEKVH
jgi:hypothetical protein